MLKYIILLVLIMNSFTLASEKVALDYKPKKSSARFFKQHFEILKNFHIDIHVFSVFSLVDDRFKNEYATYIKDREEVKEELFTLTYKF